MKKALLLVLAISLIAWPLAGCDLVKEGVTGEKPEADAGDSGSAAAVPPPSLPAAYDIIGDWFGVYNGNEYLELRFTADGKCELQPALYPSEMFGPRYYGDYRWGGADGKEILLDLYKGVSKEVDYGNGNVVDEWSDGGRESATTALTMSFYAYGGAVKSVALKAVAAGIDTDGYTVVKMGAFLVMLADSAGGGADASPFLFGTPPFDPAEGKSLAPVAPDTFSAGAERFYTTDELNVRCGPDTENGTYGTVPNGTPVDKIGGMASGHDDWVFVLLEDGGGWVNTGYLASAPPENSSADTQADTQTQQADTPAE